MPAVIACMDTPFKIVNKRPIICLGFSCLKYAYFVGGGLFTVVLLLGGHRFGIRIHIVHLSSESPQKNFFHFAFFSKEK